MSISDSLYKKNLHLWLLLFGILVLRMASESLGDKSEKLPATVVKCDEFGRCTCPTEPITSRYPDPDDPTCEMYYLCHLGFGFKKKCEVRQAFHPDKKECLPRSQVPFLSCPPPIPCVKNGFTGDPQDCTKYYMCFYMQAYHYSCKVKHYYDAAKEKCILNKTQTELCSEKTRIKITTSTSRPLNFLSNEVDEILDAE